MYNLQGDVTHILNTNRQIVGTYKYDPWGEILNLDNLTAIAQANPFRYRGYYYDSESNLYYLNSRYYNPELKRFISADGYIDNRGVNTQNLFHYCGNNPIGNIDSSGQLFGIIFGIGILAVGIAISFCGCTNTESNTNQPTTTDSSTLTSPTTTYKPSQQEKSYAATVYAEAGGQNKRTKQAVAHVMNNRIGTRSSWTDIEAVLSAKGQFDGYNNRNYINAMNYYNTGICDNPINKMAMDECLAVVIPIYSGTESDITGGALYFHSFSNPSDWAYHDAYTQVYISGTEKFWFYK